MVGILNTDKRPLTILVHINTSGTQRIRIIAKDAHKINTVYEDRECNINGKRTLEIKMPKSPTDTQIIVYNMANGVFNNDADPTFTAKLESSALKACPMWMSKETASFVKFAQEFCENAGILSGTQMIDGKAIPSIYASDDGKFQIHYFDKIVDRKTGQEVATPARVGHDSGIIEVSKSDFNSYTIPVRMVILLHEFAHFNLNKRVGLKIENESGADINALMLYFSMGYSEIEAHKAFLNVFKNANNEGNHKRYKIINDFIGRYSRGEIKNCYIETKSVTIK